MVASGDETCSPPPRAAGNCLLEMKNIHDYFRAAISEHDVASD